MKRFTMFAVAAIFVCGFAFGADEPGQNYEHLKPLEWGIGVWVHVSTLQSDVSESFKAGDPLVMTLKNEWVLPNKNAISNRFVITINGKVVRTDVGLTGWDAEKKRIVGCSFTSRGGRSEIEVSITEHGQKHTRRTVSSDGTPGESTSVVTRVNADTMRVQVINTTVGGEKQPDRPALEFKRKEQ